MTQLVLVSIVSSWLLAVTGGIAIANHREAKLYAAALQAAKAEADALHDRLQASSLAEFRAFRPVVTPALPEAPYESYEYDPFGLFSEPADPADDRVT